jgi:hypothetical protein
MPANDDIELGEVEYTDGDFEAVFEGWSQELRDEIDAEVVKVAIRRRANALLRERLARAPRVFDNDATMTTCGAQPKLGDTHMGFVVSIRRLGEG